MDFVFSCIFAWLVAITRGQEVIQCPDQCICFATTVRCMFLGLNSVPDDVAPETTILDLRFNKLTSLPRGVFRNLHNLDTLLLNNNELQTINDGTFEGLDSLKTLFLYKNEISSIQEQAFQNLQNLEQLYLHFNQLSSLEPRTFEKLPKLERLFLQNNAIQHLPRGIFKDLKDMKRLRLDSNALICDCGMFWLSKMLRENEALADSAIVCQGPSGMEGMPVSSLQENNFHCTMPEFTAEPTDVSVQFGETVRLTCRAEGDPAPAIIWLHDNEEVETNRLEPSSRYELMTDGTLMIHDAELSDQGSYECVARNDMGEIRTNAVQVRSPRQSNLPEEEATQNLEPLRTLRSQRPRISIWPSDATFVRGDTMELNCQATGHPVPDIRWEKNDLPLPLDPRIEVSGEGVLSITEVLNNDRGLYRCIATNSEGRVTQFARVEVLEPPEFTQRPANQHIVEGHSAFFSCDATGEPLPTISWTKDDQPLINQHRHKVNPSGTTLSITRVQSSDAGVYACVASIGASNTQVTATLTVQTLNAPRLVLPPVAARVAQGSSVTFMCSFEGDPQPRIKWLRDDIPVPLTTGEKYEVSPEGSLRVKKVRKTDEGVYECLASNVAGSTHGYAKLSVIDSRFSHLDENFINRTVEQSARQVDQAVSNTFRDLNDPHRRRTPSDLLRLMRYPPRHAVQLSRAAEIYEQALETIYREVHAGAQYSNITYDDISYQELLTPAQLTIVSSLSGCEQHRRVINCEDMCFHHKYRNMDGTCNNLQNPMWGASLTPLRRLQTPRYENDFNLPLGWTPELRHNGYTLPSARTVSLELASTDHVTLDQTFTHMLMQWGQFLDHDLDFVPVSVSNARFTDGRFCNETCDNHSPCFAIPVADNDPRIHHRRCIGFARSSAMCGSGVTSVVFQKVTHRDQVNLITSYIDASNVYGNSEQDARGLRDYTAHLGLLRTGLVMPSGKPMPPPNNGEAIDCQLDATTSHVPCFQTGDHRSNEQLGLLSMHTVWFREHNRMAEELHSINPHWDGDMLYHEARKIMGAMHQHITYKHWLPLILGTKGMHLIGEYKGYNSSEEASIMNAFAAGAFRFGHSLINPIISRLNESFQPIPEGNLPLHKAFFAPFRIVEEGGIDPILRGLFGAAAKKLVTGELLNKELTEKLFKLAHEVSLDLAALNTQRGRDHGLASYNDYRQHCGFAKARSFDDLRDTIRSSRIRRKMARVYGHVDNVELWVAGLLEDVVEEAKVGPTFMCIIAEQFRRLRDGDRFYYENPGVFEPSQLAEIRQTSLARVICDNSDNIEHIQPDVFRLVNSNKEYIDCESARIPRLNLNIWSHCCHDCSKSGDFGSVTTSHGRTRRSAEFSYPEQRPQNDEPNDMQAMVEKQMEGVSQAVLDTVDARVEGIEDLMQQMHRHIKKLNKKLQEVRKMEQGMDDHSRCVDHNGHWKDTGDVWHVDDCKSCHCINGVAECNHKECPELRCENVVEIPGECCAVCP